MSQKKKFVFKGKQVLLLGLAALVITAGYYRWTVESEKYKSVSVATETVPVNNQEQNEEQKNEENGQNNEKTEQKNTTFSQLKRERDSARGASLAEWKKVTEDSEASADAKKDAEKKIKSVNESSDKEKTIETLVKAKGYEDCFVHINENGVTLKVAGGELNGSKVAQIKDIIVAETNVPVRNIKISAE